MYHVLKLARSRSTVAAGKLLHASILYLPVVLGLMVLSKLPAR
jgi:heme O synthase-like polyprenyltransferase